VSDTGVVVTRWVVIAGVLVSACGSPRPAAQLRPGVLRDGNVLLITIDTLRRDRIGAYGNPNGLTPTLDSLAANGFRYANAHAHVPMTLPSHASILTGLTPLRTGVRNNTTFRLDDRIPTLATHLKPAGYSSAAVVGAFVLDARFGLSHDFASYDDQMPLASGPTFHVAQRRASEVTAIAGRCTDPRGAPEQTPRRRFTWVHLFDPHTPYDAPPEFRIERSAYDAEVAYTDAAIGAMLNRLRACGELARTLIVVTADHGESLGDHGETTHGLFAYDATLAVPLIINGPGIPPGVSDDPVAHADIVPTILDLLGLDIPPGLDGLSLARPRPPDRAIYFEALDASLTRGWAPLQGLLQNGLKYIDLPDAELYDLRVDPGEQHNLIGSDRRGEAMRAQLAMMETASRSSAPAAPLDAEAAARLRSLGYVGGPSAPRGRATLQDDPKRLVALNERFNTALTAFDEGRRPEAFDAFTAILRERPDFLTARTSAATVLIDSGRAGDAVALLRAAPPDQRDATPLLVRLGAALRDSGDLRAAADVLERAHRAAPQDFDAQQDLAIVDAALGRADAARALFQDLVDRNKTSASAWYNLGLFELQSRRPEAAAAAFSKTTELQPANGEAWNGLGAAIIGIDRARAIDAWTRAERLLPRDYDLLFNLAMVLADSHEPVRALPYLRRFAAEAPPQRYAADIARVRERLARLESRRP
jgi:tetratricopeptide (TPR) repeat protein